MVLVGRVGLLWHRQVSFLPQLGVCLEQPGVTVRYHWVAEPRHIDTVPCATEDNITRQDFVFKRRSKSTWTLWILHVSLDRTTDTRNSLELSSSELCNFSATREHAFDKGCVLHDLVRLTNQLQLFHDLK